MSEKVEERDFIEIDYTGKLSDGTVFDTTIEEVAKNNNIHSAKTKYGPMTICVGERQILPGLDDELVGKEINKEYTVNLQPEKAFGKRDIKKMKIVPMNTFKEHKVQPQPGLQIDVDGEMGVVTRVSGGRVIVNFNHPLSGREVSYIFNIKRKIENSEEKIKSFLNSILKMPEEKINVELKEEVATVMLPMQLPPQFTEMLGKRLTELIGLKEIKFEAETKK